MKTDEKRKRWPGAAANMVTGARKAMEQIEGGHYPIEKHK